MEYCQETQPSQALPTSTNNSNTVADEIAAPLIRMAPPTVASFQFESAAAAAHEDQVVPPVAVWRPASGDGSQRPKGGCCDGDPRGPAVSTSGTT